MRFEIARALNKKIADAQNSGSSQQTPYFDQIQIKINMPPGVTDAALLVSHGAFQYRKAENAGYWTM